MTDSMTALHLILVQFTCPGDQRVKPVQFQSTCNLCRESHKTQVWLCFLVVSFLSISTCAAATDIEGLQKCLLWMRQKNENALQRSDAMLYAPSADDIKTGCEAVSLKCFIEELIVVLNEENIIERTACIPDFNRRLNPPTDGCPHCETYPLKNITVFLHRLKDLMEQVQEQNTK